MSDVQDVVEKEVESECNALKAEIRTLKTKVDALEEKVETFQTEIGTLTAALADTQRSFILNSLDTKCIFFHNYTLFR